MEVDEQVDIAPKKRKTCRRRTRTDRHLIQTKLEQLFFSDDIEKFKTDSDGYFLLSDVAKEIEVEAVLSKLSRRALVILGEKSTVFQVSSDGSKVRLRSHQPQVQYRTVYVDNLPSTADKGWLEAIFAKYGTVVSVDLPSKNGANNKGFGFVHFASAPSVLAACKDFPFDSDGEKISKPQNTKSIADTKVKQNKRCRRRKRRKLRPATDVKKEPSRHKLKLQVLSLQKWKQLRKDYLSLQKQNMGELKRKMKEEPAIDDDFSDEFHSKLRGRKKLEVRAEFVHCKRLRTEEDG